MKDYFTFGDTNSQEAKVVYFEKEAGKIVKTIPSPKKDASLNFLSYMAINEGIKMAKESGEESLVHSNLKSAAFHVNKNWKNWNSAEEKDGDKALCSYVQSQLSDAKNIENVWFTNFAVNDSNDIFYTAYGKINQLSESISLADIRSAMSRTSNKINPFSNTSDNSPAKKEEVNAFCKEINSDNLPF